MTSTTGAAFQRVSVCGKVALLLLGGGMAALCVRLWPQWRHNPDLSHGFFMPAVFLLLLYEARSGSTRYVHATASTRLAFGTFLAGGLAALILAGLYAAAVDWSHALVNLMLTVALVSFLVAALFVFAADNVRLISFNWTALVAALLWLLTAPIPPGTYSRLTLALQLWVSEAVLRSLHLLGVAAIRHGNIIDLSNASVGVEEACSGVRSLISCVFAGLFFSATLVRRVGSRVVIIALAAPIALVMNFLRSLTLTLLANQGIDISGTWHDVTGFAVLGMTAAILGGLAVALERRKNPDAGLPARPVVPAGSHGTETALAVGLGGAMVLSLFFAANTRSSSTTDVPVPDLFALLPGEIAGWTATTTDLYSFSGTLQTDHLAQRTYRNTKSGNSPVEIVIYVAYWRAGQVPVSLVASHTPDACWPGSGWQNVPTEQQRAALTVGGRALAPAEHRLFLADSVPQHVWFWHLYDRQPLAYRDPYSAIELLRLALQYGFRRSGDQLFVRVSCNRPWEEIAREPVLAEFFARTRALGL